MKKAVLLAVLLSSVALAHSGSSIQVAYSESAIVLDGNFDEPAWAAAQSRNLMGPNGVIGGTVKFVYDSTKSTLYAAFDVGVAEFSTYDVVKVYVDLNHTGSIDTDFYSFRFYHTEANGVSRGYEGRTYELISRPGAFSGVHADDVGAKRWQAETRMVLGAGGLGYDGYDLTAKLPGIYAETVDSHPTNETVYKWPGLAANSTRPTLWADTTYAPIPPAAGSFSIARGTRDSGSTSIRNWSASSPQDVEMLQFTVSAGAAEGFSIDQLEATMGGTGNDANDITRVLVVSDSNSDGVYDQGESVVAQSNFVPQDNAMVTFVFSAPPRVVPAGLSATYLIVYTMSQSAPAGKTYSLVLDSVTATGQASGTQMEGSGTPVTSGVLMTAATSQPPSSCAGSVSLEFPSTEVDADTMVSAEISGLSDCAGKEALIFEKQCNGPVLGTCLLEGSACSMGVITPEVAQGKTIQKTYYACVDKDNDGIYSTAGEQDSARLTIRGPAVNVPPQDNKTRPDGGNQTGGENRMTPPSSGGDTLVMLLIGAVILMGAAIGAILFYFLRKR